MQAIIELFLGEGLVLVENPQDLALGLGHWLRIVDALQKVHEMVKLCKKSFIHNILIIQRQQKIHKKIFRCLNKSIDIDTEYSLTI